MSQAPRPRPPFESLPLRPDDPPFSAWGLYGDDDQLGALNLLTAENTLAAARSEIRTGVRLSLDPPIDVLLVPGSERSKFKQTIYRRGGRPVHDDIVEFNTQIGAQWDGFRHVSYIKLAKFYNGTSVDDISGPNAHPTVLGTDAWVRNGAIAGRGVLLDYYSWSQAQGKQYDLIGDTADHAIPVEELQACAAAQGVEIRQGDLLFVRSGFWVGYNALSDAEKIAWSNQKSPIWVGVETSAKMAKWLWDSGIVAGAGDAPGWERIPNYNSPPEAGLQGWSLHEIMLSGWGMPIGESLQHGHNRSKTQ
ncbi:hypothetical protein AYO21_01383 [Fonsecaea monophora]|uniref:Cyclase n=1 Tax=Fonsecaea monophora TaxID=254056 RepID=A0A177FJL7_9EURO|nr:hypothetical protein AYO21_01383 [Fonsecaea monophora]OAG44387.1 hypothetical protein AYO21_01383 [Fonsecaea monophora]